MRRPFMTNPDQLVSLDGQQYPVLRPTGAVPAIYRTVQDELLTSTRDNLKHPHTEHATLRGSTSPSAGVPSQRWSGTQAESSTTRSFRWAVPAQLSSDLNRRADP